MTRPTDRADDEGRALPPGETMKTDDLDALDALAQGASVLPWRWREVDTWPSEWGHSGPDLETVDGETRPCPYYCVWRDEQGVEHRGTGPAAPHEHFYVKATVLSSWGHDADGVSIEEADAAYIVAACNAVPALIARIRELEADRARGSARAPA